MIRAMADTDRAPQPRPADERRHGFPAWIWPVYVVLFGASVPWYLPADAPLRIWFGLPHWVVLSLTATAGVAVFTAFVVHRLWPDE